MQDLKRETENARNLASQYRSQVSSLYQSSTAVIVQVNAALERSAVLGNEVQAVFTNGTQVHQESHAALTAAHDAVSRANHVYGNAQRMLHVARDFETESRRARVSANKSLLNIPWIQNTTYEIMKELSEMNESSTSTLSTATEALELGSKVQNLSVSEQQVCFLVDISLFFLCNAKQVVEIQFKKRSRAKDYGIVWADRWKLRR